MKLRQLLLSFLALLVTETNAYAETQISDGIYYGYDKSKNKAWVAGVTDKSYSGHYVIRNSINDCPVIYINPQVFYKSQAKQVDIPNSVGKIYAVAFWQCSLDSITFGNGLTIIDERAFLECPNLRYINIPDSVTSIGQRAFEGCSNLRSINIPDRVTSIEYKTFYNCTALKSVTIGESVTSIGNSAFSCCRDLTSINIPNSVDSIYSYAFGGCHSLTPITIPNNVTYIGQNAFANCRSLTSVTIPNSVTEIDVCTFTGCSGLTSVTIGNSVTSIGSEAFYNCSGLKSVTSLATTPPALGNATFSGISSKCVLTIPAGTRNAYISAGWTDDIFKGGIVEDGASETESYRYYNFVVTGLQGDGGTIQFSEFDLLDEKLNEVEGLNVYAGTDGFTGESWPNITDNDVHTKFCSNLNNSSAYFLFDATSNICPYGYRLYTASDTPSHPERNPSSWKLYASNTKLTSPTDPNWTLIDERNNDMTMQATSYLPYSFYIHDVPNQLTISKQSITLLPSEEFQLQVSDRLNAIQNLTLRWTSSNKTVAIVDEQGLVVAKGVGTATITVTALEANSLSATCTVTVVSDLPGHRYYQFAIEAIAGGEIVQLSEFDLLDKNGKEITPLTTYAYTGQSFDGESQEKLFDDDIFTKYCGSFITGTTLYIFIDAGKKVTLSGYRMTTGNDTNAFPGRNPVTWSLLGSNAKSEQPDDSAWMLLDRRENDNTLGAEIQAPYDFFFTYPQYYVINDETTSFNIEAEESGKAVAFSHAFNGEWEALYLPFAIDYDAIKADFDLAEIDGIVQNDDDNDGIADFTVLSIMGFREQMTTPNTPYLIRAKKAGMQTINFEDVTVYPTTIQSIDCSSTSTKYEFTGSYNTLNASALTERYIVQGGELVKGASSLAPCRWYMTATARKGRLNLPAKIRIMPVEDVITGVSLTPALSEGEGDWYDLSGRKLGSKPAKPGLYIQNGKKIVIK